MYAGHAPVVNPVVPESREQRIAGTARDHEVERDTREILGRADLQAVGDRLHDLVPAKLYAVALFTGAAHLSAHHHGGFGRVFLETLVPHVHGHNGLVAVQGESGQVSDLVAVNGYAVNVTQLPVHTLRYEADENAGRVGIKQARAVLIEVILELLVESRIGRGQEQQSVDGFFPRPKRPGRREKVQDKK